MDQVIPLARRMRGVIGTSLVWGGAWLLVGLAWGTYRAISISSAIDVRPPSGLTIVGVTTAIWTVWGLASGAAFAVALTIAERRQSLDGLSMLRVALWGAIGANVVPVIFLGVIMASDGDTDLLGPFAVIALVCALIGAVAAASTLAVARRPAKAAA
jgi:hypothetical protein